MKWNSSVIAVQLSWATTSKAKESTTMSGLKCRGWGEQAMGRSLQEREDYIQGCFDQVTEDHGGHEEGGTGPRKKAGTDG
jgi:hypothetical protein